jgi:hypothetical protein
VPAVVLGLVASILLLLAGSALWLQQGSYNPLLTAQCIWFWGYTIENQAALALASNFKLLSLSLFNPLVYLFGTQDFESSSTAAMRMGVDGNYLRNAGGTIFFSTLLLLTIGVLAVFFVNLRATLRPVALLVIKVVLPASLYFSLLWLSFIPSNPNKKPLFWASLFGLFYFFALQTG